MTNEEVERAIEFLIDHHAKMSADIERHSEQIGQLTQAVSSLTESVQVMREEMDANRVDLRLAIDNLIIGNEATRDLANKVASLEVQTSQRVTRLEHRVDDLEQKP